MSVCKCQATQEKEVNLRCNENANPPSSVNLCCQSASQPSIVFQPLTKPPAINPTVPGTNHSTEPFPSFITDKSISLIVMFSIPCLLSIPPSISVICQFVFIPLLDTFDTDPSTGSFCGWCGNVCGSKTIG